MQAAWLLVMYVLIVMMAQQSNRIGLNFLDRKYPSLSVPVCEFLFLAGFSLDGSLQFV